MARTLKELAREALDIQSACNLTGLANGLSRVCSELRVLFPGENTEFFNQHPIVMLWLDKMIDLNRRPDFVTLNEAYTWCENVPFDKQ